MSKHSEVWLKTKSINIKQPIIESHQGWSNAYDEFLVSQDLIHGFYISTKNLNDCITIMAQNSFGL
jgi:hypothetical protein